MMRWLSCLATRTSQSLLCTVTNSPSLVVRIASTRARKSTSLTWALSILTLPSWIRSWWMAGSTFSASSRGTLTRTVSPLLSELITRTCSQRSFETEVVDWLELAGAALDCAKASNGESMRAAAAMRAVLQKKALLRSDMTGCLLAGAAPVLGDRYERGARKVSWKGRKLKVERRNGVNAEAGESAEFTGTEADDGETPRAGGGWWAMGDEERNMHHSPAHA